MAVEIKVPALPESIADATVAKWYKAPGDSIKLGENLVDLETDKVMLEVPSPVEGVLQEILKPEGTTVTAAQVLATVQAGAAAKTGAEKPAAEKHVAEKSAAEKPAAATPAKAAASKPTTGASAPVANVAPQKVVSATATTAPASAMAAGPSVRRLLAEQGVAESTLAAVSRRESAPARNLTAEDSTNLTERQEKRVPMSRLRARIAERLVAAQHTAAMLTTFNEINMQPVMDLRARYKDTFEKAHGVRLGFMSFFVKAAVEALKRFPAVNASIDGNDVVYHGYFDIGIAVSSPRGLVVPVLRDADQMSMAQIEKAIGDYAAKAKDGKLTLEEMTGGTFTITNGGIFGSMLSTPILNPPQSAILGMHNITKRPVVEDDAIVIRPMMYVAMSYDHRIIDGRESVTFLVTIKQMLEDPARLLLEV